MRRERGGDDLLRLSPALIELKRRVFHMSRRGVSVPQSEGDLGLVHVRGDKRVGRAAHRRAVGLEVVVHRHGGEHFVLRTAHVELLFDEK